MNSAYKLVEAILFIVVVIIIIIIIIYQPHYIEVKQ